MTREFDQPLIALDSPVFDRGHCERSSRSAAEEPLRGSPALECAVPQADASPLEERRSTRSGRPLNAAYRPSIPGEGEQRWNAITSDASARCGRDRTTAATSAGKSLKRAWSFLFTPAVAVTSHVARSGTPRPTPELLASENLLAEPHHEFRNECVFQRTTPDRVCDLQWARELRQFQGGEE